MTTRGENYVLKVRGDSMIDDGIMDGDYVIVARRERADNGEMVVANVNGEVTLKRFYREGERVRLQPANSKMTPIYATARDVAVQGVVVGLMRRFDAREDVMDLVLKLREIRRMRGLSQKDVARLSGVGEKTISSFETGQRIGSLKLAQLKRLLAVYGMTEAEFFGGSIEKEIAPWELDEEQMATSRLLDDLRALPKQQQKNLLGKFQLMVETLRTLHESDGTSARLRSARTASGRCSTSRN